MKYIQTETGTKRALRDKSLKCEGGAKLGYVCSKTLIYIVNVHTSFTLTKQIEEGENKNITNFVLTVKSNIFCGFVTTNNLLHLSFKTTSNSIATIHKKFIKAKMLNCVSNMFIHKHIF